MPHPHLFSAGYRPDRPLQGIPAAETQDTGFSSAGGGPLPDPDDPYAGGGPGGPDHCPGPWAERGPD